MPNQFKTNIYDRIVALDLLRGTFLIIIITTHIAWHPSLYTFVGGGGELFASAAEGFFTISGLLVGYIYGPRILANTKKVFLKIWRRAALLYILATFFTFFYTAWAVIGHHSNGVYETTYSRDGIRFLVDTFTLRYAFGWAEFLNRYAVFMFAAPFAVWLIAKGKAWLVATLSVLVWLFLRETDRFLPFSSWQIVFMTGIILGYYLPHIEAGFRQLHSQTRKLLVRGVGAIAIVSYILSIVICLIIPFVASQNPSLMALHNTVISYFDKEHLAPARLAIGVVWFAALYYFYRIHEKSIVTRTRGILEVFGKNSLFVYSLHAFILFVIDMYFAPTVNLLILNTLVTTIVLLLIYCITKYRKVIEQRVLQPFHYVRRLGYDK